MSYALEDFGTKTTTVLLYPLHLVSRYSINWLQDLFGYPKQSATVSIGSGLK
jgi:hypothetical protein